MLLPEKQQVNHPAVSRWVQEIAQWGNVLAARSKDLSLIPGTHTVEGENQFLQAVLKLSSDVYPDGELSTHRQTDRHTDG